jgi:UDP-GlcNAc:undecaprenyl-phosphate GlcNAc-1-phosphate transferase
MSGRPALRLVVAGTSAWLGYAALSRRQPGDAETWMRTNHRGEPVTLLEGPAVAVAAAVAAAAVPGLARPERLALALAGLGAGGFGCYDDLAGRGDRRGFRGHLGALVKGDVTTGAVKIAGIGLAGLGAGLLLSRRPGDVAINAGLVAGGANLVNLFDLRPGRAIKVSLLASAALAAAGPGARAAVAAPAGAAIAVLPEDLGERAMLGDSGANALGAMLGVAAASALPKPARIATLAGVIALTAASEKISFTKVIARTPALQWLDMLGRRPVAAAATTDPASGPDPGPAAASGAPAESSITPEKAPPYRWCRPGSTNGTAVRRMRAWAEHAPAETQRLR